MCEAISGKSVCARALSSVLSLSYCFKEFGVVLDLGPETAQTCKENESKPQTNIEKSYHIQSPKSAVCAISWGWEDLLNWRVLGPFPCISWWRDLRMAGCSGPVSERIPSKFRANSGRTPSKIPGKFPEIPGEQRTTQGDRKGQDMN